MNKTTLAIMQPYLFPYIGYWQLIHSVDKFVIYDDVNYIKHGYINRNSILSCGKAQQFTLELLGASSNKLINRIEIGKNAVKIAKTIKLNYSKAPFLNQIYPIIEDILNNEEKNLAKFIEYSIRSICSYMGITTKIICSSSINKDNTLKAQDKVIHICTLTSTKKYINSIGGQSLYCKDDFQAAGIELKFIKPLNITYKQFNNDFVPYLSIIDILMFNDVDKVKEFLDSYELI